LSVNKQLQSCCNSIQKSILQLLRPIAAASKENLQKVMDAVLNIWIYDMESSSAEVRPSSMRESYKS
jgi:hypothetical protein